MLPLSKANVHMFLDTKNYQEENQAKPSKKKIFVKKRIERPITSFFKSQTNIASSSIGKQNVFDHALQAAEKDFSISNNNPTAASNDEILKEKISLPVASQEAFFNKSKAKKLFRTDVEKMLETIQDEKSDLDDEVSQIFYPKAMPKNFTQAVDQK